MVPVHGDRAARDDRAGRPARDAVAQAAAGGQADGARRKWAVLPAVLLAIGVACGIAGLFPDYLNGESLAHQHVPVGTSCDLLRRLDRERSAHPAPRPSRLRVGTLLGMGTSIVTFGLFFADAGTAISRGAHVMGAGFVLGLGWLAGMFRGLHGRLCAQARGSRLRPAERPRAGPFPGVLLAALGVAAAFAPSWDSYVLQTSAGTTESLTAGNVFSNPAPVIAGNVAVMVAFVAVVVAAALWRPILHGTALLAGAVMPMVAQAISAVIQIGEHTSPTMFGISPSAAAQSGLTITSGLTLAFWIYCVFVLALMLVTMSTLISPRSPDPVASPSAAGSPVFGHGSPAVAATPPGPSPIGPEPPDPASEPYETGHASPPAQP